MNKHVNITKIFYASEDGSTLNNVPAGYNRTNRKWKRRTFFINAMRIEAGKKILNKGEIKHIWSLLKQRKQNQISPFKYCIDIIL